MTQQEKEQVNALMEKVTQFVATLSPQDVADLDAGRVTFTVVDVPCPACAHPEAQHDRTDGVCAVCHCDRTNDVGPEGY